MAVTKAQLDAAVTGISYYSQKPANPMSGDVYADPTTGIAHIFDGFQWIPFSTSGPGPKSFIPTEAELKAHPSLKAAWEEYIVIRRLLGL